VPDRRSDPARRPATGEHVAGGIEVAAEGLLERFGLRIGERI
jgi:hypothetical protein